MIAFSRPADLAAFAIEKDTQYVLHCTNQLKVGDYLLGVKYAHDEFVVIRPGNHSIPAPNNFSMFQLLMTEGSRERLGVQACTRFIVLLLSQPEKNGVCLGISPLGEYLHILPQIASSKLEAHYEQHAVSLFTTRTNKTLGPIPFGQHGNLTKNAVLKALDIWLKKHASDVAEIYESTGPSGRTEKKYRFIPNKNTPARSALKMLEHVEKHIGRCFKDDMQNNAGAYPEILALGSFEPVSRQTTS